MGLFPVLADAQALSKEISLNISGEVKTPLTLTPADIDTMTKTSIAIKDKNGKEHVYSGVDLYMILKKAGVTVGEELRGKNLTKYILTEASDGYQVIFSLAETDPSFSQKKILLANRKDNVPLPANEGAFRIVIKGEQKQTRFIRQIVSIKVKYAN